MSVSGFFVHNDFISEEEGDYLLKLIDDSSWTVNRQGTRKVQIYGPWHDSNYKIVPNKVSDHPPFIKQLAQKVCNFVDDKNKSKLLDQNKCEVYINEYTSSDSLQYHYDSLSTYDDVIYGISLCSDAFLGLKNTDDLHKVLIPKNSLYIMSGDSRKKYKHGIDEGWITGRRVSITFRTVKS
jgi:alkylated DNA repair dioxygenase AlkB